MHNLHVNLASAAAPTAANLNVLADTTPRTPEILNSLIAMTSPLDNYAFGKTTTTTTTVSKPPTNMSSDSNSSCSSQLESPTTNPPSVQQTCSQLIKAGLKLSIEQKRKHHSDGEDLLDLDKCKRIKKNECSESEEDRNKQDGMLNWTWCESDDYFKLTPEDEERRRRRRERNKIAATKCRLKKREKTANLVNESETLETQNIDLKSQLQELQNQKRGLLEMLSLHRPHCQHNITPATRESLYRLPPVGSVIDSHSYSRPASVDASFRSSMEAYSRVASVGTANAATYTRTNLNFKAPSIVIEDVNDYQPQLTNLDNPVVVTNAYHYNSQCHNYTSQSYTQGMDNGCMA